MFACGQFATNRNFLSYGNSDDVQRGLAEITNERCLTMEQEWARNDSWVDWRGVEHSGRAEYTYVTGIAVEDLDEATRADGKRDAGHAGWTLVRFSEEINGVVRANAAQLTAQKGEEVAAPELNLDEVLAIRLYTGPAYQPVNEFLREVSKLGGQWRRRLAGSHSFSYAATVRHLSHGLRKLARVSVELGDVYRGVRGELPEAFWLKDAFGMITATDFGFMSTSLDRLVSEGFLGGAGARNVLWKIECSPETDDGFHSAADVSALSQFPAEREMLFPPLTMLQVRAEEPAAAGRVRSESTAQTRGAHQVHQTAKGAEYICLHVTPTFV